MRKFLLALLLLAPIALAQTTPEKKPPRPRWGHKNTFSLKIKAPEKPVKKGATFEIWVSFVNTADQPIDVHGFGNAERAAASFDIRDSRGTLAFTDECMTLVAKNPPFGPDPYFRSWIRLKLGEEFDQDFVQLGDPEVSCFESNVPGTYTIRLRKVDPYTGTLVYSNKVKFTIEK